MEQVLVNGLYLGMQYALIALGLTLIFALMILRVSTFMIESFWCGENR